VFILAVLGIGLALVGGIFIGGFFRRAVSPVTTPTPPPPLTETVIIVTHDVPLGSVLNEGDVTEMEVPLGIAPRGTMRVLGEVLGRMVKTDLVGGQMVMSHHLANPTNVQRDLAFILSGEQVLMAFPANDLMSSLDILERGDIVDILVSIEQEVEVAPANPLLVQETQEPQTELFTFDAIQRIEIAAMVVDVVQTQQQAAGGQVELPGQVEGTPQPTPTPSRQQVNAVAILLAMSPQDALVLKHLKDAGGVFDIVLRAPTSNQLFELEPVWDEYLIDRYELEVER
jgi:pilus assembly protein CpaB